MKKILVLALLFMLPHSVSLAAPDKIAHFGVGYILNDQLKQHTKLTFCERMLVVTAVSYAKEKHDKFVDHDDIVATIGGALFYQIKF